MPDYTFTQPVRYYKSNDPYYYEIDNIPIRQLEENILYLKQNIEEALSGGDGEEGTAYLTQNSELDLTKIKQLRAKLVEGRTIGVNAGKFTARVNDVYGKTNPLINLVRTSAGLGEPELGNPLIIPEFSTSWTNTDLDAVWESFTDAATYTSFNMNGLETAYTFHQTPGSLGGAWEITTANDQGIFTGEGAGNYPHYLTGELSNLIRWPLQTQGPLSMISLPDYTIRNLQNLHLAFVKMWSSAFRTAVVDFPQSYIEVDPWSDNDYYYYDENGTKQTISGVEQRIDLLFAYTMPIDVSSVAINDYTEIIGDSNSPLSPKQIIAPRLGIIKGAGVGLSKTIVENQTDSIQTKEGVSDQGQAGSLRILSNKNDQLTSSNYGITDSTGAKVHGSFPSPDDLINQAANLVLASETDRNALHLVGQTALPLAYIVVKKGQTSILQTDIIDIRPFLRTTELAYNERAGIGSANPPLSFSNPAVGSFQLKDSITKVNTRIDSIAVNSQSTQLGKPLYMDYVMGGIAWGVEGTLLTMNDNSSDDSDPWGSTTQSASRNGQTFDSYGSSKDFLDDATTARRRAFLEYVYNDRQLDLKRWLSNPNNTNNSSTYLNLPTSRNIPLFPEWQPAFDINNALVQTGSPDSTNDVYYSDDPTFWMWLEGFSKKRPIRYVPGAAPSTQSADNAADLNSEYLPGYNDRNAHGFIQSCMKRFEITLPSWVQDYDVLVEYVNCSPFGGHVAQNAGNNQMMLGTGLSVNKGSIISQGNSKKASFTITSAAQGLPETYDGMIYQGKILDASLEITSEFLGGEVSRLNQIHDWLSYTVCLPEYVEQNWRTGAQSGQQTDAWRRYTPKMGASYYPTVKFTIIGYPVPAINNNVNYQAGGANGFSKTLIPDNLSAGISSEFGAQIPLYDKSSINISQLDY